MIIVNNLLISIKREWLFDDENQVTLCFDEIPDKTILLLFERIKSSKKSIP